MSSNLMLEVFPIDPYSSSPISFPLPEVPQPFGGSCSDSPTAPLGSSLLGSATSITAHSLSSIQNCVAVVTSSSSSSWAYAIKTISFSSLPRGLRSMDLNMCAPSTLTAMQTVKLLKMKTTTSLKPIAKVFLSSGSQGIFNMCYLLWN